MNDLLERINKIWWWHCIDLKNGIITPGHCHSQDQLQYLKIPENLQGKTVLDIGAWDGYFSFLAEERGAFVTATDDAEHSWGKWGTGKQGFDLAREIRQSKIQDYISPVDKLSSTEIGKFDIVFFFGVFYHLKNFYDALERVFDLTNDMAIIETATMCNDYIEPIVKFYRNEHVDKSNYFAPNVLGLVEMCKSIGFQNIFPAHEYPLKKEEYRVAFHAFIK